MSFLLMKTKTNKDLLTVWSLCAGHLCSLWIHFSFPCCAETQETDLQGPQLTVSLPLLHLGLANRKHQQEIEGLQEAETGHLVAQEPSCKGVTDSLCPSPEPTFSICELIPYGCSLFPGSLTGCHPCPFQPKENNGSLLFLALGCCTTTVVFLQQDHTLHIVY